MNEKFIEMYKRLPKKEKFILKDLLNDFFLFEKSRLESKNEKSIILDKGQKYFDEVKEIYLDEIKEINDLVKDENKFNEVNTEMNKEFFGIENLDGYEFLMFPFYKNINFIRELKEDFNIDSINHPSINGIYVLRKEFISKLDELGYLILDKWDSIKNGMKDESNPGLKVYKKLISDIKEEHGEDFIKDDLKLLNNIGNVFRFLVYKTETIKELVDIIDTIDNPDLILKNNALIYNGKVLHCFERDSQRLIFINYVFGKKKNEKILFGDIYGELDKTYVGGTISEKQSKIIRNLIDKLNTLIKDKGGPKKTFFLNSFENKSSFYRKY